MNRFLETQVLPYSTNIISYSGTYPDGSEYVGVEFTYGRRNVSVVLNKRCYHVEIGTKVYYDLNAEDMENIVSNDLNTYA